MPKGKPKRNFFLSKTFPWPFFYCNLQPKDKCPPPTRQILLSYLSSLLVPPHPPIPSFLPSPFPLPIPSWPSPSTPLPITPYPINDSFLPPESWSSLIFRPTTSILTNKSDIEHYQSNYYNIKRKSWCFPSHLCVGQRCLAPTTSA